ncbi:MAG: PQQ-binding-like beta-propeller repeat protein [Thermoanaerobaculia bacterium]|nr:PQQ-binding-like beta-propeller repeat protein [Thermoanaerobaculia bacterium]
MTPEDHPQKKRSEPRGGLGERWIVAATVALLVLLPMIGGRFSDVREPGGDREGTPRQGHIPVRSPEPVGDSPAEDETTDVDPASPWRFATAGEVWSQPVAANDLVLVGSDDGTGYALDAISGRLRWNLDTGSALRVRATVLGQTVVWASVEGEVHAADVTTGEALWRTRASATTAVAANDARSPDDRIVVGTAEGLLGLETVSGRVAWRTPVGAIVAAPAVSSRKTVAGTRTGAVVAVDTLRGNQIWTFDAGAEITTSPALAGRFVLITAGDGSIYCLELATGRERWRSRTSEFVGSTPAVAEGRVFVGGGDGALWAFDLRSGIGLWRRRLAEPVRGTPVADGDTLWMAAGEHYVAAVRASDGEPLHVFAVEGWVSASPRIVGVVDGPKRLVFATADGSVHGIPLRLVTEELAPRPTRTDSGPELPRIVIEPTFHDDPPEILWQKELPARPAGAPAVTSGLLVSAAGPQLLALDPNTGREIWRARGSGPFSATPALADRLVLAPSRADQNGKGAVTAFDLGDGRLRWRAEVEDDVASIPALWHDLAIFGTAGAEIVAVEMESGSTSWQRNTGGVMTSRPAVAAGSGLGIVIAGGCDGVVYGLAVEDGRELWQFPTEDCVATDIVVETAASGQEVALVADAGGHVYALDPVIGGELWRSSLGGAPGRRPLVLGGSIYVGSEDGSLWSLSALHGGTRWRFAAGGPVSGGMALDLGIAYAASTDGALHAVGAINGQEFWRLETPDPAYDVALAEAIVYVTTGTRLYALRTD